MVFPPMVGVFFDDRARSRLRRAPESPPPDRRRRCRPPPHHTLFGSFGVIAALFRRQRFARFQHRLRRPLFSPPRSGLVDARKSRPRAACWRSRIRVADLFEAGGELHGLHSGSPPVRYRRCGRFSRLTSYHQLVSVVLHGFNKRPRLEFGVSHATCRGSSLPPARSATAVPGCCSASRLGAVHKQLQALRPTAMRAGPVRIGDAWRGPRQSGRSRDPAPRATAHGRLAPRPADAHHRHLRQRVRAHGAVFLDQRRRVAEYRR